MNRSAEKWLICKGVVTEMRVAWIVLEKSRRRRPKGHREEGRGRRETLDSGERGSEEMGWRREVVDVEGDEVARAEE